jgi:hypothetical protein
LIVYSIVAAVGLVCTAAFVLRIYLSNATVGSIFAAMFGFISNIVCMMIFFWQAGMVNELSDELVDTLAEVSWKHTMMEDNASQDTNIPISAIPEQQTQSQQLFHAQSLHKELQRALLYINVSHHRIYFKICGIEMGRKAMFYQFVGFAGTVVGGFVKAIVKQATGE